VQEWAVGPARGDGEAIDRHDQGLHYNAAALVVHLGCLAKLKDSDLDLIAPQLVMVRRADRPRNRMIAS